MLWNKWLGSIKDSILFQTKERAIWVIVDRIFCKNIGLAKSYQLGHQKSIQKLAKPMKMLWLHFPWSKGKGNNTFSFTLHDVLTSHFHSCHSYQVHFGWFSDWSNSYEFKHRTRRVRYILKISSFKIFHTFRMHGVMSVRKAISICETTLECAAFTYHGAMWDLDTYYQIYFFK